MIPLLNEAGRIALAAGTSLLFQTAALVAVLLLIESVGRHRLRSALRCGLWLLVIAKLLLPPTLISPVSPGYWLGRWIAPPIQLSKYSPAPHSPRPRTFVPSALDIQTTPEVIGSTHRGSVPIQRPTLEPAGLLLCLWVAGSLLFSGWLIRRNHQVHRLVRSAVPASPSLQGAMARAAQQVGLKRIPELRLSAEDHSPAVCGLLRPVIVLPVTLAESLNPAALRDVLLHELIHIRRGDLWIHLPQTFVQVLWWWNPLAWLANARIRVLREQAVDEEVMVRTGREHDATYPETLVTVARYCSTRPLLLSINLVGIVESRRGLRARVEHLLHHPLPARAGLGVTGWIVLTLLAVVGLPMAYSRRVEAAAVAPMVSNSSLAGGEITGSADPARRSLHVHISPVEPHYSIDGQAVSIDQLEGWLRTALQMNPDSAVFLHSEDPSSEFLGKAIEAGRAAAVTTLWIEGSISPPATGTTVNANIVGYVTFHELGSTNILPEDPKSREHTLIIPTELARRYGIDPAGSAPAGNPPSSQPAFPMDPELMKRYGLAPATTPEDPDAGANIYRMDPVLLRRYGITPPSQLINHRRRRCSNPTPKAERAAPPVPRRSSGPGHPGPRNRIRD